MGMRRLAAVLVVAACAVGSARLWSDALTPAAVPFVEPFASPGGFNAPQIVVVAAAEPRASRRAPNVVRKTIAKGAPNARILIAKTPIASVAPAQTSAQPAPKTPAKPVPAPQPPKATPPVVTPAPPAPPVVTPAPPTPSTPPPAPSAPAAAVPIAPVVQPAVPPPAPPPVQQPAQSDSRPGHGYGDKNHSHTGPPGQQG